jgi:hypothetical protein
MVECIDPSSDDLPSLDKYIFDPYTYLSLNEDCSNGFTIDVCDISSKKRRSIIYDFLLRQQNNHHVL